MPCLSASAVVIHYEEALYQVYVPLPLHLLLTAECEGRTALFNSAMWLVRLYVLSAAVVQPSVVSHTVRSRHVVRVPRAVVGRSRSAQIRRLSAATHVDTWRHLWRRIVWPVVYREYKTVGGFPAFMNAYTPKYSVAKYLLALYETISGIIIDARTFEVMVPLQVCMWWPTLSTYIYCKISDTKDNIQYPFRVFTRLSARKGIRPVKNRKENRNPKGSPLEVFREPAYNLD